MKNKKCHDDKKKFFKGIFKERKGKDMKRLIINIMAGLLLLACPTLHAQRVLYIGDSVTDGG